MTALWLCAYLTYSLHMWYPHDTWGEDVLCTISGSKRSKVKVTRVDQSFGRVLYMAPSLFDLFTSYVVHTPHEVTMCCAPFPGPKVKATRVDQSFCRVALQLCPFWTDSLQMWYTHNPSGDNMLRTLSGSEGQRSKSHGHTIYITWIRKTEVIFRRLGSCWDLWI